MRKLSRKPPRGRDARKPGSVDLAATAEESLQRFLEHTSNLGATDPAAAASLMLRTSERVKEAIAMYARQHQLATLKAELAATNDPELQARITANIARLSSPGDSPERRLARQRVSLQSSLTHRAALMSQWGKAATRDEKAQIKVRLEQVDKLIGAERRALEATEREIAATQPAATQAET